MSKQTALDLITKGGAGRVETLNGDRHFISRATAMGFAPGASLAVVQNTRFLPLIVYLKDTLVAIDRDEAKRIQIHETH